ncbi:MAG TPA: DUF5666 domain-containing protein [Verrucomicrobiae bacterium]|nr:DUF5666 domain-containing protein [Verrucomicrobiae bacterium]
MDFAPTEQPDELPEGPPAEQPAAPPAYVAAVQPVTPPSRRSRSLIAGAIIAGAIGIAAVAIVVASPGTPTVAAPAAANARGVLLGADTGTWTPPSGGAAAAPDVPGMMGGGFGPSDSGPGAMGPGGMGRGGRLGGGGMFASISITAIDGTKLSLSTADGWTRTVDAAGATITKAGQTVDFSTLKAGDSIVFDQSRQTDGTFKITAIQVVLPHADGTVKVVGDTSVTLTQRDGTDKVVTLTGSTTYQLFGLASKPSASTKAALTVGDQVDAQGTTASDGSFTASLVTIRAAEAGGTVTAKSGTSITVTTRGGTPLTINVDASTTYLVAGTTAPTLSNIAVGSIVIAEGTRNTAGTFSATTVRAFAAGSGVGPGMMPGMRGGRGMPWGPGRPAPQPTPTPAGTTN